MPSEAPKKVHGVTPRDTAFCGDTNRMWYFFVVPPPGRTRVCGARKKKSPVIDGAFPGAGDESRTRDFDHGKVVHRVFGRLVFALAGGRRVTRFREFTGASEKDDRRVEHTNA